MSNRYTDPLHLYFAIIAGFIAADQQVYVQPNPTVLFYDNMYKRKINRVYSLTSDLFLNLQGRLPQVCCR